SIFSLGLIMNSAMTVYFQKAFNNQKRGLIEWRKNRSRHFRNARRKKRACSNERIKRRAGSNQKPLTRAIRLLSEIKILTSLASVPALSLYRNSGIMLTMTVWILMASNKETVLA